MSYKDLRDFLNTLEKAGDLRVIENVDWDLELGAIAEVVASKHGPALLFDKIKDYPAGYRVAALLLNTIKRSCLALGLPADLQPLEAIKQWKAKSSAAKSFPPKEVASGPVQENQYTGEKVDLNMLPAPKWHEADGGRYLGTGSCVITRDPDTGYMNLGTYRMQIHDQKTVGIDLAPGRHGRIIMEKYHSQGKPCPVVAVFGSDPALFIASFYSSPWQTSEFDIAGLIHGSPIEVIRGKHTDLPIPAWAEAAIEGEIVDPKVESKIEGPFGEYTGYYTGQSPLVVKVKSLMFRDDPIILGSPPLNPTYGAQSMALPIKTVPEVWQSLQASGVTGVVGVWEMPVASRMMMVVSIKQMYPGHSRQAGMAVAASKAAGFAGRFVIVVDDDVDPSNMEQVLWAVATRCDPESAIDIVRNCWSGSIDPLISPEKRERKDFRTSRAIIDACRPYYWKDKFPKVNKISEDLAQKTMEKWRELFVDMGIMDIS
ncbi:MAG: UbiD family decarboxylase [Thaumarchaeota archaeon]|nr:UbiD family decarboxylase [Nitrososphaerota archaeon]